MYKAFLKAAGEVSSPGTVNMDVEGESSFLKLLSELENHEEVVHGSFLRGAKHASQPHHRDFL